MTFDELNSLIVAIRAHKINYNYFTGVAEMTITPEYGVKDEAKGKTFILTFEECIYFLSTKISKLSLHDYTEFISWGKSSQSDISENLIVTSQTDTISADSKDFNLHQNYSSNEYSNYFFENTQGDILKIICKKVIVSEQIKD